MTSPSRDEPDTKDAPDSGKEDGERASDAPAKDSEKSSKASLGGAGSKQDARPPGDARQTAGDVRQTSGDGAPASRAWMIGIAAACVVAALFVGRSWGLYDARQGARGAGSSAAVSGDPAGDEIQQGLTATDPNEAVSHFRKALEINPTHYGATFQLARALDRAGLREEATKQWERVSRAAEQQGDAPLLEMARARLAQRGGAPDPLGVPQKPAGDPMAQGVDALYKKRDPALAIARFREVLAQTPDHYGATFQLAAAYDLAGDFRSSRPLWEKMAAMADASSDQKTADAARQRMAEIDKALGPPAAADPDADAMKAGMDALYAKKDVDAAIAQFRAVLKKNPTHYGALYQLATALDQAKKPSDARPLWEKVLKMAEALPDEKTAAVARERLSKKP